MVRQRRNQTVAASTNRPAWWIAGLLGLAALMAAYDACAQQSTPASPPQNGVVTAPSVDPAITTPPPMAPATLPTPVIPPPGTPGGDPNVVPK